ncbi:MAG: polyketide synthase [Gammaproteobacteria bacterium HGW-Gammaproteobacteria-4]|jgi:acyl transferase domain-containing protein|nr:MAG: polyketide synthase [Gammaproteobacteria bacterium HGW-Gammaproteobacteria-4]
MSTQMDGIAIVGMSGRFPGAPDVPRFWANIRNGVESVSHFSVDDLEIGAQSIAENASGLVCAKGLLDDIDLFDARFFGYLPREAEMMDPQHRVFLEICSEALEHAGYDASRYPGAIGVFGGCYMDTYLMWNLCSDPAFLAELVSSIQVGSLQTELGNDKDYLATRVAFKLGLRGPAMTLQTACSTSLVAIVNACQSIASYQCDMALAGGVTIVLPQKKGYQYKEGGMLSHDGRCRTFDENSAGTVFSNGAAVVLLKRVEDAVAAGDTIYGVIRGYAINNDGGKKVSYTAPSVEGQTEVISLALAMADIDARTIGYVEAHGTATPIGDPIEVSSLTAAYRAYTADTGFCAIGSVKANLGHLDIASGAIGLIKTALCLHERVLPPQINFTRPNPRIDFANSPFYVNTRLHDWPAAQWPRRAGVSSFGVGGTNAHVIVEEAPTLASRQHDASPSLLILSARSESALAQQAERLGSALAQLPDDRLADAAYTLQVGRREFEHRRFIVADTMASAAGKLLAPAQRAHSSTLRTSMPRLIFMFPGQGAQYPGMAAGLYRAEPAFRDAIDRCCNALASDHDLAREMRSLLLWQPDTDAPGRAQAEERLEQTRVAQPAMFAMEMALCALLANWSIRPSAVMGHSVGEYAAACAAGVFSIEDGIRLVAARARLMQAQPTGRMLAVRAALPTLAEHLPADVGVAAVNAPELVVLSGPTDSIETLSATLLGQGIHCSALRTSHAFHSSMMNPVCAPLADAVSSVARHAPSLEFISTARACRLDAQDVCDPAYWAAQLLEPVRFADSVVFAASDEHAVFVEVGPGQTLGTLARQSLPRERGQGVVSCLGPLQAAGSDRENLMQAVGRLWLAGITPDWEHIQGAPRARIALPTYPFERKRFWVQPAASAARATHIDTTAPPLHSPPSAAASATVAATPAPWAADAGTEAAQQVIERQLALIAAQIDLLADTAHGSRAQRVNGNMGQENGHE